MRRLILLSLAIVALGAVSVPAQDSAVPNLSGSRRLDHPNNIAVPISGGSTVTPGGVTVGRTIKHVSRKNNQRTLRRRTKKS